MDMIIFETPNFTLEIHPKPFVSREEGGHIKVIAKDPRIHDRTSLTPNLALEFMWLSSIAGEALMDVMNNQGIPVVKINYEELGNWAYKDGKRPVFHLHIFGRANNAKVQVFPEAVQLPARETGFYNNFKPLTENDISLIHKEIQRLEKNSKFDKKAWGLEF